VPDQKGLLVTLTAALHGLVCLQSPALQTLLLGH
jgi:hypothetical protein